MANLCEVKNFESPVKLLDIVKTPPPIDKFYRVVLSNGDVENIGPQTDLSTKVCKKTMITRILTYKVEEE